MTQTPLSAEEVRKSACQALAETPTLGEVTRQVLKTWPSSGLSGILGGGEKMPNDLPTVGEITKKALGIYADAKAGNDATAVAFVGLWPPKAPQAPYPGSVTVGLLARLDGVELKISELIERLEVLEAPPALDLDHDTFTRLITANDVLMARNLALTEEVERLRAASSVQKNSTHVSPTIQTPAKLPPSSPNLKASWTGPGGKHWL